MYVFVDDSGDAGFKIGAGSSKHLVIACCVFETSEDVEIAANTIRDFRRKLNWHPEQEFKFSKTREDIRLQFLTTVLPLNFFVRAIVIDKTNMSSEKFSQDSASFYHFAIKEVLSRSLGTIRDAKVRVDGKGSREYVKAASKYLKAQANQSDSVIAKVKFVDSKGDQLIQLADMVAGFLRKCFDAEHSRRKVYLDAMKPFTSRSSSDILVLEK